MICSRASSQRLPTAARRARAPRAGSGSLLVCLLASCARAPLPAEAAPAPAPSADVTAIEVSSPVAAAGRPMPPSPSAGCGRPPRPAGALVMQAGKLQTPLLLTLPEGYDGAQPVPLVFAFHGRTRSHQTMHDADASHLADELGRQFAVAYVKSVGLGFDWPGEQRDNLQVFDAAYERLLEEYCVDTERVFALGHSSGGLFSELLACERSPRLRGIASVAGAMTWPDCPGRAAALLIHGERDSVVSISRGHAARDHFRAANGCSEETESAGAPGCVAYRGCEPSLPVEWCVHSEPTYEDTNHGWPSFASAEIARFFGGLARPPHPAGTPLLVNESFDGGSDPWQVSFMGEGRGRWAVQGGALCATLEARGDNPWDAQLAHSGLKLEAGRRYALDARVWASAPTDVRIKLGLEAPPYSEYWQQSLEVSSAPRRLTEAFPLVEPPPGPLSLGFQLAGSYARQLPVTLCIDEVSLTELPSR